MQSKHSFFITRKKLYSADISLSRKHVANQQRAPTRRIIGSQTQRAGKNVILLAWLKAIGTRARSVVWNSMISSPPPTAKAVELEVSVRAYTAYGNAHSLRRSLVFQFYVASTYWFGSADHCQCRLYNCWCLTLRVYSFVWRLQHNDVIALHTHIPTHMSDRLLPASAVHTTLANQSSFAYRNKRIVISSGYSCSITVKHFIDSHELFSVMFVLLLKMQWFPRRKYIELFWKLLG